VVQKVTQNTKAYELVKEEPPLQKDFETSRPSQIQPEGNESNMSDDELSPAH